MKNPDRSSALDLKDKAEDKIKETKYAEFLQNPEPDV